MGLRITASLLSLLCSWVLWEKLIVHGAEAKKIIQAVYEAKSLSECRAAVPDSIKQREIDLKKTYKEPKFNIMSNETGTWVSSEQVGKTVVEYVFYCLPSTVDPYHDTR